MTSPIWSLSAEAAALLTLPTEPYLSCDDCFALMDAYVDDVLQGDGSPDNPWTAMRVHLSGCGACAEEVDSLRALVSGDDPAP